MGIVQGEEAVYKFISSSATFFFFKVGITRKWEYLSGMFAGSDPLGCVPEVLLCCLCEHCLKIKSDIFYFLYR